MLDNKFVTVAKKLLKNATVSGDEISASCPFHSDNSPSLRLNVRKAVFYCHGCGATGRAEQLFKGQRELLGDLQSNLELLFVQLKSIESSEEPKPQKVVPPERTLLRYDNYHTYWGHRGFSEDTIDWWQLGYDPLTKRLTIPLRDENGTLLGVTFRQLGKLRPKYLYPKGFVRSRNLFGSSKISGHRTVLMVEGSLDAIKIWQAGYPALSVYGSSVAEHQVRLLHRLGITRVLSFFDADEAGYKAEAEARVRIKNSGLEYDAVYWPWQYRATKLSKGSDPGGLQPKEIRYLLDGYFTSGSNHVGRHTRLRSHPPDAGTQRGRHGDDRD